MFDSESVWDVDKSAEKLNQSLFKKSKKKKQYKEFASSPKTPGDIFSSRLPDSDDETFSKKQKKKLKNKKKKQNKMVDNSNNEMVDSVQTETDNIMKPNLNPKKQKLSTKIDKMKSLKKSEKSQENEFSFKKAEKSQNESKLQNSTQHSHQSDEQQNKKQKKRKRRSSEGASEPPEKKMKNMADKSSNAEKVSNVELEKSIESTKKKRKRKKKKNDPRKNKYRHLALSLKPSSEKHPQEPNKLKPTSHKKEKQNMLQTLKLSDKSNANDRIDSVLLEKTPKKKKIKKNKEKSLDDSSNVNKPIQNTDFTKEKKIKKHEKKREKKDISSDDANDENRSFQNTVSTKEKKIKKEEKKRKKKEFDEKGHDFSQPLKKLEKTMVNTSLSSDTMKTPESKQNKLKETPNLESKKLNESDKRTDKTDRMSHHQAMYAKFAEQLSKADETRHKTTSLWGKSGDLAEKAREKLNSARFRYVNEQLYTCTGKEAFQLFKQDKEAFHVYHEGFDSQTTKWPVNPLDIITRQIKNKPPNLVIADFGCGDAKLAASVPQKVHSFDLVALNDRVTVCDMAKTPLQNESVDIAVFCLSLMGTNIDDYLHEANRVLKMGGLLKIAEVSSRFSGLSSFIAAVVSHGFVLLNKRDISDMFYFLEFKKNKITRNSFGQTVKLKPCVYKRR